MLYLAIDQHKAQRIKTMPTPLANCFGTIVNVCKTVSVPTAFDESFPPVRKMPKYDNFPISDRARTIKTSVGKNGRELEILLD